MAGTPLTATHDSPGHYSVHFPAGAFPDGSGKVILLTGFANPLVLDYVQFFGDGSLDFQYHSFNGVDTYTTFAVVAVR